MSALLLLSRVSLFCLFLGPSNSQILAPVVLEHPDPDTSWEKDLKVLVSGAKVEKLKVSMEQLKGLNAGMLQTWGYKHLDLLKVSVALCTQCRTSLCAVSADRHRVQSVQIVTMCSQCRSSLCAVSADRHRVQSVRIVTVCMLYSTVLLGVVLSAVHPPR